MAAKIFSLRNVPDDEADEVRALLEQAGLEVYETPASAFGVSAGALWLREDSEAPRARELLAEYQLRRQQQARRMLAEARAQGQAPSLLQTLRAHPVRTVLAAVGILLALALTALPVILLGG